VISFSVIEIHPEVGYFDVHYQSPFIFFFVNEEGHQHLVVSEVVLQLVQAVFQMGRIQKLSSKADVKIHDFLRNLRYLLLVVEVNGVSNCSSRVIVLTEPKKIDFFKDFEVKVNDVFTVVGTLGKFKQVLLVNEALEVFEDFSHVVGVAVVVGKFQLFLILYHDKALLQFLAFFFVPGCLHAYNKA